MVEQLLQLGFTIYQQVEAANAASASPATLKPLADIIADANSNFAAVQTASAE